MSGNRLLRNLGLLLLVYLVIAGAVAGHMYLGGRFVAKSTELDPERVALGETLYRRHCAECHGVDLAGEPDWETLKADGTFPAPPQNETGHTPEHSDRQLFEFIKQGGAFFSPTSWTSNMPAYKNKMDDREIWSVLTYIKSRWPESARKKQAAASYIGGFQHH